MKMQVRNPPHLWKTFVYVLFELNIWFKKKKRFY